MHPSPAFVSPNPFPSLPRGLPAPRPRLPRAPPIIASLPALPRRAVLAGGLAAAFLAMPSLVHAAVPTLDDYNGTETTTPRVSNFLLDGSRGKKTATDPEAEKAAANAELAVSAGPAEVLKRAAVELDVLRLDVARAGWDDARSHMRTGVLGRVFFAGVPGRPSGETEMARRKFFGLGTARRLEEATSGDAGRAAELESLRVEVELLLRQVEEAAFGRRVIFFNGEDRQQVQRLEGVTGVKEDTSDVLEIVDNVRAVVGDMEALLK